MAEQSPKLKWKEYSTELKKLQTELCLLQDWVKKTGQRIIIVFEGRDAAGKGGLSNYGKRDKRYNERLRLPSLLHALSSSFSGFVSLIEKSIASCNQGRGFHMKHSCQA
jgi:hypothetical protein